MGKKWGRGFHTPTGNALQHVAVQMIQGGLLEGHKGLLRKAETRTREAPIEAMGWASEAVTVHDILGVFAPHCGYRTVDQLL